MVTGSSAILFSWHAAIAGEPALDARHMANNIRVVTVRVCLGGIGLVKAQRMLTATRWLTPQSNS